MTFNLVVVLDYTIIILGGVTERLNRDLWMEISDVISDYRNIGIRVITMFLEQDNYHVLNTLVENPIRLALQASDGTNVIKDEGYEKTLRDHAQKS